MYTHAAGALGGDYKARANEDLVIAVQIEHPQAVEEIDQICATGIDVAFVCPSTSLLLPTLARRAGVMV